MQVVILDSRDQSFFGRNLRKLALHVGADGTKCILFSGVSKSETIEAILGTGECALFTSVSVFKENDCRLTNDCFAKETEPALHRILVIYGFDGSPMESVLVNQLTQGRVVRTGTINSPMGVCEVDADTRDLCGPLSGVRVPLSDGGSLSTFHFQDDADSGRVIMTIDGNPFFILLTVGHTDIFLLGVNSVPDLDEALPNAASALTHFAALAPFIVCLRYILKEKCWRNDSPRACFVLDDPLLKEQYGFVNYSALLEAMRSHDFCTSLAFIPWNYRRTKKAVARFLSQQDKFSLSVHGFDHTEGEFGCTDEALLRYKAVGAIKRMDIHQQLSGLPFDRVMVFPQGVFSTTAMRALKSSGYLAAVNSILHPVDMSDTLTLRDLLEVALTRFSDFPVFVRRYPYNLAELAFDLFLGKPALLVEHHTYFRDGYGALSEIVHKLRSMDARLEWANLSRICSRASLKRVDENGDVHIKFYTDRFHIENEADSPQDYVLFRDHVAAEAVSMVTVNDNRANWSLEDGLLEVRFSLKGREVAEVRIEPGRFIGAGVSNSEGRTNNARVFIRRVLSGYRDNYLDRSRVLSGVARSVLGLFAKRVLKKLLA